jgi:class 3 adenylate cyclase
MLGALGGATNGLILMGAILGAEILLPPTRFGHALERVPFLVTLTMKVLVCDGARPVACFFGIERALARAAPEFERQFGAAPRLRAALHGGHVITGEVGGSRRAIVYHGDVMNTTARIEQATRDLERPFLVSRDAMERLADLEGFVFDDLGLQRLRGRAAAMHLYAVSARPSTDGEKATGRGLPVAGSRRYADREIDGE